MRCVSGLEIQVICCRACGPGIASLLVYISSNPVSFCCVGFSVSVHRFLTKPVKPSAIIQPLIEKAACAAWLVTAVPSIKKYYLNVYSNRMFASH